MSSLTNGKYYSIRAINNEKYYHFKAKNKVILNKIKHWYVQGNLLMISNKNLNEF